MTMMVMCLAAFVGGCGGGDDNAEETTATTRDRDQTTTTVQEEPASLPRLPEVFAPIPGYTYEDLPDSTLDGLAEQFMSDPDTAEAVDAADGKSVSKDGEPVGVIIAVGFDKKSAALPGVEEGFVSGATEDAVSKKTVRLSGEDVTVGTDADGLFTFAWLKGTIALVIIGDDEAALTPVATALVAANK
jgi:hypothetical protein